MTGGTTGQDMGGHDTVGLATVDSFPYRHRLAELMSSPVVAMAPDDTLDAAAKRMDRDRISSIIVSNGDGRPLGIVTERDVLRLVARGGLACLDQPLSAVMSSPVECLPPDVYLYRAIARMDRLGIRHLAVTDDFGRAVGVITARGLLRQRAGRALALGDEVATASGAGAMAAARARLPEIARGLLAEDVKPAVVTRVISGVMRDLTHRAAELALADLAPTRGPPPAPWCLLILGSGGRGESLLAPDQDNALIHGGQGAETEAWFAAFGERIAEILDRAGVPLCKGGIMASRPDWRGTPETWATRVDRWIGSPAGDNLLAVDIFYDFRPVAGDFRLAAALRDHATRQAAGSIAFLKNLSVELERYSPPLSWLGGISVKHGRCDLKMAALFPVVAAARVLALRYAIPETGTSARLRALAAGGHLPPGDVLLMRTLHRLATGLILNQQLVDIAQMRVPSSRVEVRALDPRLRQSLRSALANARGIAPMVRDALV